MKKSTQKTASKRNSKPMSSKKSQSIAELEGKLAAIDKAQAIIEFGLDGTVLTANENFLKVLGYSLEEIQGKHHRMFCDPLYVSSPDYPAFWQKLNRGEFDAGLYKRIGKGGKEAWIQATYNPVFDAKGKPVKVVKFATDVTAAQAQTLDVKGKLDALDRAQGIIEFGMDGRVLTANQNFLQVLGYSLDEIRGEHHRLFCDPVYASSPAYAAFWQKLNRGEFDAGLYKRIGKGGKEAWIQATYNPIFDANGKPFKVVKFATDVTAAQNEAAENRSKSEALDRVQGVIELTMDGTIISVNQAFAKALGYSCEELLGKHHRIMCDPAFAESRAYGEFWAKLNLGQFETGTAKRFAKGGREVWLQASYNPILGSNGKPQKVLVFALDVTAAQLENAEVAGKMKAVDKAQAIIEFGMDGKVLTANDNFLRVLGYTLDEVKGQHHKLFCDPAYVATHDYTAFWQKLNRGEFDAALYRRKGKGGKDVWIQATYNPIFDLNGKPFKVVKFATDVTAEQLQIIEMEKLVAKLLALATNGDLSGRLATDGLTGLMQTLAKSINQLMDVVAKPIAEVKRVSQAMAGGDLQTEVSGNFAGEFAELQNAFNDSIHSIRGVVEKIQQSTAAMQSATQDISQGNNNLSQRTQEQSSALEETASSLEEMTSTVKQNASNATQANQLASSARAAAEKGGSVVSSAIEAMQAITESSKKVADIIGVIEQLAFQTNMLALNAAVEAARAGDQGRGFAVVAAEVRNLAQRSASAAKEIKVLLQTSSDRVAQGATLVNNSGEALKEIVLGVKKVSDIIAEINVASDEQASGISQINQAVTSMDKMTQQNAALVEEAATAADSMNEQARGLIEVVGFFKSGAAKVVAAPAPSAPAPRKPSRGAVVEPALEVHPAAKHKPAAQAQDGVWESF